MNIRKISILSLVAGGALMTTSPARANTVLFSDNFDAGNLNNWVEKRNIQWQTPNQPCWYYGQAAHWLIKNGMAGIDLASNPCVTELLPKNLDLVNVPAYEYEFDWQLPTSIDMNRNVVLSWQDANNWYGVMTYGTSLYFEKVVGGTSYTLPNSTVSYAFQANQTYHWKISYLPDKKIQILINGAEVLNTQDQAPFLSGSRTIGLRAGVGANPYSSSYFDNIVVRSISANQGKQLAVPLFKQTDPAWNTAADIYDSATTWADPGKDKMSNWGCATTSMAMIMRYYGMTTLPDGQPLNPGTLNAWLKSQVDGYLGGSINWVAATRLTRLINAKLGTPKLEFARVGQNVLELAKAEISADKPVILEIVGHFLVGMGVTADSSTLYINDPAYRFTTLAQHQTPLVSMRTFQPSFTDLSYIILAHSADTQVLVKNQQGQAVTTESFTETIIDPSDPTGRSKTPGLTEQHIAKPVDAQYTIEVKKNTPGEYSLQVYSYDAAANPTISVEKGAVNTAQALSSEPAATYNLKYKKQGKASLEKVERKQEVKKPVQNLPRRIYLPFWMWLRYFLNHRR